MNFATMVQVQPIFEIKITKTQPIFEIKNTKTQEFELGFT